MRPTLQVIPPRADHRVVQRPSIGRRSVLFLCEDTADVDTFAAVAQVLRDCDVAFAPRARPERGAWLIRHARPRPAPPSLRVVERCAERGLALDLRRVPLDHELVVRAVVDEHDAHAVDHVCVAGHALRRRLSGAGIGHHRLTITGSMASDDDAERGRSSENVAAVCRALLDRPPTFRELRFWREMGILRDW
jgi:hypothetical protein